jgi:hypothetical protein
MLALFAGPFRVSLPEETLPSAPPFDLDRWAQLAGRHRAEIADVAAIIGGAGIASLIYSCCGLPEIGRPAIVQMAVTAAIIAVSGLRHCGLYPDERAWPPVAPARISGALLVACLAALGLAYPDAPRHGYLWIWAGAWMAASLVLLVVLRLLARGLAMGLRERLRSRLAAIRRYLAGRVVVRRAIAAPAAVPSAPAESKMAIDAVFALDWWPGFDAALVQLKEDAFNGNVYASDRSAA